MNENNVVYIPRYVWHEVRDMSMNFTLLVLSDKNYDPGRSGFIESYDRFKTIIKQK